MSAITHPVLRDASVSNLGATSTQLLAANSSRNFLLIGNTSGSNDIWVNLSGGTAAANGTGCIFLPKGPVASSVIFLEMAPPANAITAIATGSSTTVTVLEG